MMFITAIPTVFAAYLVVFGDVIQARAVLEEATEVRTDEKVKYNENRAHMIFGGRNLLMGFFGPDTAMCGPLWAAMHVTISERYKKGPKTMQSIFSGAGSFRWGTNTGLWLLPVVSLLQPILGVALALTLLIQGFVSIRVGITEARSRTDLGIAGVTAAVLATNGAAWGFATGILLTVLIYTKDFFKSHDDGVFKSSAHGSTGPIEEPVSPAEIAEERAEEIELELDVSEDAAGVGAANDGDDDPGHVPARV